MTIQETILKLLLEKPFYGYVGSKLTPIETESINHLKIVLPSYKLLYNLQWFNSLSEIHKEAAVMHELLHLMLLHPVRGKGKEEKVWTVACDMAVNEQLKESHLNSDAITVIKVEEITHQRFQRNRSAEYYYKILLTLESDISLSGNDDGEVILADQGGNHLKADIVSSDEISDLETKLIENELQQTINQAYSEGEVETKAKEVIDEVYVEFKINWRKVLKRFLTARGKIQTRRSYKRQSRRFDYLPGTKRSIGVKALVAIDESGSISNSTYIQFLDELKKINRITGASIEVVSFDTKCSKPISLKSYVNEHERVKNGGTDFNPVFELADEMKMPIVIIFTDGDGPAPESANQKTLWVITEGGKKPTEFGQYVTFNE